MKGESLRVRSGGPRAYEEVVGELDAERAVRVLESGRVRDGERRARVRLVEADRHVAHRGPGAHHTLPAEYEYREHEMHLSTGRVLRTSSEERSAFADRFPIPSDTAARMGSGNGVPPIGEDEARGGRVLVDGQQAAGRASASASAFRRAPEDAVAHQPLRLRVQHVQLQPEGHVVCKKWDVSCARALARETRIDTTATAREAHEGSRRR